MADMYDTTCSSSSSPELEDISLFLHQILLRSSSPSLSSSSSALMAHNGKQLHYFSQSHLFPQNQNSDRLVTDPISTPESSSGLNSSSAAVFSSSGDHFTASTANVYSSSGGIVDTDPDEYDCESEEGFEGLAAEVQAKPSSTRNPSKRSRAAEVHNLSEKRRRSRINEKMKALQNLIPNSNKTDKASMLDEAIDYLKQLQLQVQMLTMRNGLSLSPMCLPGVLQPTQLSQTRMGFYEGNGSQNMNLTGALAMNQETPTNTAFSLPNQCSNPNQPSVANLSNIINSDTLFGLQSSIPSHFRPFQPHTSSEENCREDLLHHQQLNVNHPDTNPLEFKMGVKATMSIPFDSQTSDLKDNTQESCILGRDRAEAVLLNNLECNHLDAGRRASNDDIKNERSNC